MSYKESKFYSVINNKCPHCHQGNFWETNNPYNLKRFAKMNAKCPVCNEDFKREPGFYFGATYVSYGLTVTFGIVMYLLLAGAFKMNTVPFLVTFSVLLIVLMPLFYRLARIIWINMFVPYKKS
jgi:uncharacterized protein (DUF983 family)